jgi:hypothetical protein
METSSLSLDSASIVNQLPEQTVSVYGHQDHIALINNVQGFYNDAFTNLLTVSALLLGLIGFVLPLIHVFRSNLDRKRITQMTNELSVSKQKIEKANQELEMLQSTVKEQIKILTDNQKTTFRYQKALVFSAVYHLQAMHYADQRLFEIGFLFSSMPYTAIIKNERQFQRQLDQLKESLSKIKSDDQIPVYHKSVNAYTKDVTTAELFKNNENEVLKNELLALVDIWGKNFKFHE